MSDVTGRCYYKQNNKKCYKYTNNSGMQCFLYETGEISEVQNLDEFLCKISGLSGGLKDEEIRSIVKNINSARVLPSINNLNIDKFNELTNDESNFITIPLSVTVQETVEENGNVVKKDGNNHNDKIIKLDIFDTNGDIANIFKMNNEEKIRSKKTITITKNKTKIEQYYYYKNVIESLSKRITGLDNTIGQAFELETRIISKKIQMADGCTFNSINFIRIAKDCRDKNDLEQQMASGELQFKVMAETSKQMQSWTGNIQIIKNLGRNHGEGTSVILNGEGNNRYIEFNLGESRFAMSLSQDTQINNNRYIFRPGLIRSIGDKTVIENIATTIKNNQQFFGENIKNAVFERQKDLYEEENKSNIIELGKKRFLKKIKNTRPTNYNYKTKGINTTGLKRTQSLPTIGRNPPQQQSPQNPPKQIKKQRRNTM